MSIVCTEDRVQHLHKKELTARPGSWESKHSAFDFADPCTGGSLSGKTYALFYFMAGNRKIYKTDAVFDRKRFQFRPLTRKDFSDNFLVLCG